MAGAGRPAPTCLLLGAAGGGKSLLARRLRHIRRGRGHRGGPGGGAGGPGGRWPGGGREPAGSPGAAEGSGARVRPHPAEPPVPQVGTNLTDLRLPRKVTVRELGGCMGPIWPSYYGECSALLVSGGGGTGTSPGGRAGTPVPSHGPEGRSRPGGGGGGARAQGEGLPRGWGSAPAPAALRGVGPLGFALAFVVDAANPTQVSSSCVQLLSVLSAEPLASVPVLVLFNKIDLPCYMSLAEMKSLFRMQDIVSCATQPITMLETSARDGTGLADVLQWLRAALGDPR
ncbi:hypothetical protein QYF61_022975 [Mycteria americana]|uniref:ADP ribosylation factor like GTPase 16 n=1 Tax=Mycteria americana TaxID=33587 RepID=A0AAN7MS26_MYCAM|nr:hypothetical protein QYF61_022975 [Mycteria americana]